MSRGLVPISPRQIDPLGWITGPLVPLAFAGLTTLYALRSIVMEQGRGSPVLQGAAVVGFVTALVLLHAAGRGLRGAVGLGAALSAAAIGTLSLLVSAVGYAGSEFAIQLWWAPISLALVFAALAPNLPAARVLAVGGVTSAACIPVATALLAPGIRVWGPVSVAVIVGTPLLGGTVLAAIFSRYVVRRMQRLLEARSQNVIVPRPAVDARAETLERARLAALTARAVPFLEELIRRGEIRTADRALAGQLARRLRDDLVTQAAGSWIDRLDTASRLVVVDPDRRADALRPPQRTALRALITALLTSPSIDAESLLVELRAGADGATAVGITVDAELPEGRRMMFLAPSMLTLEMTADDLTWVNDEFLRVRFRFPPESKPVPGTEPRRRPRRTRE
ncbi:MAG: hypothetical protein HY996_07940 [Micrococcales bacterium]|nr:hypothetical protein [Micrococcales bacterium]